MGRNSFRGIPASKGIAIGKVLKLNRKIIEIPTKKITEEEIESEVRRFDEAVITVCTKLQSIISSLEDELRSSLLKAHISIAQDSYLRELCVEQINKGINTEKALETAAEEIILQFSEVDDAVLRERADDFRDVCESLQRSLLGIENIDLSRLKEPLIIVANELFPSDTVSMDSTNVLGFITELGGATSHVAIVARGLQLPAVVGIRGIFDSIEDNDRVILDGSSGTILLSPCDEDIKLYREKQNEFLSRREELKNISSLPTKTACGEGIELSANIGSLAELQKAIEVGAEGIGLLRTEFLYMDAERWPSEEEQFVVYRQIVRSGIPIILRTLDIGGDKSLKYHNFEREENPFLGLRAIRFCLENREVFKTQLRAILRASAFGKARIMLPMVISEEEVIKSRDLISECKNELDKENIEYDRSIEVGIMIETPAAVFLSKNLAKITDFFSIGTNDLTQYILAVDRGNRAVSGLYDPFHPALLRAIKLAIDASHSEGKWAGLCGELASDPLAVPVLLGLGLDEFSVSPGALLEIKQKIRSLDMESSRIAASKVLEMENPAQVRDFLKEL